MALIILSAYRESANKWRNVEKWRHRQQWRNGGIMAYHGMSAYHHHGIFIRHHGNNGVMAPGYHAPLPLSFDFVMRNINENIKQY